jgi:hypothetical protein
MGIVAIIWLADAELLGMEGGTVLIEGVEAAVEADLEAEPPPETAGREPWLGPP